MELKQALRKVARLRSMETPKDGATLVEKIFLLGETHGALYIGTLRTYGEEGGDFVSYEAEGAYPEGVGCTVTVRSLFGAGDAVRLLLKFAHGVEGGLIFTGYPTEDDLREATRHSY